MLPSRSVTSTMYTPGVDAVWSVRLLVMRSGFLFDEATMRPLMSYSVALLIRSVDDTTTLLRSGAYAHTLLPVVDTLGWVVEVVTPSEPR